TLATASTGGNAALTDLRLSDARFFSPTQKIALEFAHGRVENEPDPKHNEDIGENRRALKEPLGVDQGRPHPAAAGHHFGSKSRNQPDRHGDPKSGEDAWIARGQNYVQKEAGSPAAERHRRPHEQPVD